MSDEDAPPAADPPGAPISRLAAFEKELIEMLDRHFNEGGLDITQIVGTMEWVKHRMLEKFSAAADAEEPT